MKALKAFVKKCENKDLNEDTTKKCENKDLT